MYTFPLYMYVSHQSRHYNTAGNLSISATIDLNANHNTCTCTYNVVLVSVYCLLFTIHSTPPPQDLCGPLLPSLSPCILRGLQDVDDDVRAVAAGSLLPVADKLHLVLPDKVWNVLNKQIATTLQAHIELSVKWQVYCALHCTCSMNYFSLK